MFRYDPNLFPLTNVSSAKTRLSSKMNGTVPDPPEPEAGSESKRVVSKMNCG
jgi:hypothetical protein